MRFPAVILATLAVASIPLLAHPAAVYTEGRADAPPRVTAGLPELAPLARAVLPAVVGIVTTEPASGRAAPGGADPVQELFGRAPPPPLRQGLATGFVIHPDGWI